MFFRCENHTPHPNITVGINSPYTCLSLGTAVVVASEDLQGKKRLFVRFVECLLHCRDWLNDHPVVIARNLDNRAT